MLGLRCAFDAGALWLLRDFIDRTNVWLLELYRMFACPNRESPLHILVMRYRHRLLRADAEEREALI